MQEPRGRKEASQAEDGCGHGARYNRYHRRYNDNCTPRKEKGTGLSITGIIAAPTIPVLLGCGKVQSLSFGIIAAITIPELLGWGEVQGLSYVS
jgi:hypothetical protein